MIAQSGASARPLSNALRALLLSGSRLRTSLMLRQVVGDIKPWCLRANEDMFRGSNTRVIVKSTERQPKYLRPLRNDELKR